MSFVQAAALTALNFMPTAEIATLRARAIILAQIRAFFSTRQVLEVETPLLAYTSVTDPYIASMQVNVIVQNKIRHYYLQTSPEYAMKRLLAAGSGPIFQLCKAFRQEEMGSQHNPEFTMLEWYRPDYNHHKLMDEMDELLVYVLSTKPALRKTYNALFNAFLEIDPHQASLNELKAKAALHNIMLEGEQNRDTFLMALMSTVIEPHIGIDRPCFVYDFPPSQAALARISETDPPTAARFEVYYRGMELANGFWELCDASEQRRRFEYNLQMRKENNLPLLPLDEFFLNAIESGLPPCAGVALGIDRLIMLALRKEYINQVISFDFSRV